MNDQHETAARLAEPEHALRLITAASSEEDADQALADIQGIIRRYRSSQLPP